MKIVTGLAFAAGLFVALPAQADDTYDKCINDSDGTNTAWAECGGAWIARADSALNETWQKLRPVLPDETGKALLEEQRAWNDYKERSCLFYADGYFGREGQVLHYPSCRADVIEKRTAELKAYLADFGP